MTTLKSRKTAVPASINFSTCIHAIEGGKKLAVIKCFNGDDVFHTIEIDLEMFLKIAEETLAVRRNALSN